MTVSTDSLQTIHHRIDKDASPADDPVQTREKCEKGIKAFLSNPSQRDSDYQRNDSVEVYWQLLCSETV